MKAKDAPHHTAELSVLDFEGYRTFKLRVGTPTVRRIIPPAGESFAFTVEDYPSTVEVSVSPTERSIRVWVDGKEVTP